MPEESAEGRVYLTVEEAAGRVVNRPRVSTCREARPGTIISAMWDREEVIAYIEMYGGAEESGPKATRFGYGICVMDDRGPLWIEAAPPPL